MPAGDRSRRWFPELVSELQASWRPERTWDAILALRSQLQRRLEDILVSRGIKPARVRCFHCGHVGPGAAPVLTVRAVLLALGRFGIESASAVQRLDKAWSKHRALQELDKVGERVEPHALAPHVHSGEVP